MCIQCVVRVLMLLYILVFTFSFVKVKNNYSIIKVVPNLKLHKEIDKRKKWTLNALSTDQKRLRCSM